MRIKWEMRRGGFVGGELKFTVIVDKSAYEESLLACKQLGVDLMQELHYAVSDAVHTELQSFVDAAQEQSERV